MYCPFVLCSTVDRYHSCLQLLMLHEHMLYEQTIIAQMLQESSTQYWDLLVKFSDITSFFSKQARANFHLHVAILDNSWKVVDEHLQNQLYSNWCYDDVINRTGLKIAKLHFLSLPWAISNISTTLLNMKEFPDCSFAFHNLTSLSKNTQKHSNHSYTNILGKKNNPKILPAFKMKLCGFLFRRWKHRLADPMLKWLSQFGMFVKPPSTSCHQLRKENKQN